MNNLPADKTLKRRFLTISVAAKILHVSKDTLRNWEKEGKLIPSRTRGGARRYSNSELKRLKKQLKPLKFKKKGLLTVSKAASLLKISPDTLRNWEKKGFIDSYRTKGGFRRFSRSEIIRIQKELGEDPNFRFKSPKFSAYLGKLFRFSVTGFLITAIVLAIFLYSKDIKDSQNITTSSDILGETEDLQSQIYQIVSSLENLQRQVLELDSKMFDKPLESGITRVITRQAEESPNLILGEINLISGLGIPQNTKGESGNLYLRSDGMDANVLFYKTTSNSWTLIGSYNPQNLQDVYNVGGDITTSDGKHINFILADTTIDASLNILLKGDGNSFRINDDGSLNDSTPFIVTASGNVGIGFTSPGSSIDIYQNTSSSNVDILRIISDVAGAGNIKFRVDSDGDIFTDGSQTIGSQADLSENYPVGETVEAGDIVVIEENFVNKSTQPYQQNLIGIVSTKPGLLLAGDTNGMPIALSGRVPVKVSDENGPIEVGDYLTSSSTPGVAMKATRPGPVLGKALESFNCHPVLDTGSINNTDNWVPDQVGDDKSCQGKIVAFINVSYADPGNFFASLSFDENGNLIIPKIKTEKLTIDGGLIENSTAEAVNGDSSEVELTPPDILLQDSAILANLEVTSEATVSGMLAAYDLSVSNVFESLGETILGNTLIAGDLTIDGILSLTSNSINSLETLYLQNSPLASIVDFFNGGVIIDKDGHIRAKIVTVAEFRVVANKISGSGKIPAGTISAQLQNELVEPTSKILITPTSKTDLVLAVTEKLDGKSFVVSSAKEAEEDISFDWLLVNESEN